MRQTSFPYTQLGLSYGGTLRRKRKGRGARPLSTKEPLHLVFKARRQCLRSGFRFYKSFFLIHQILQKYAHKFFVKIEQISVQGDHLHLLVRASRRTHLQSFLRVLSGQIAQRFHSQELLVTDTPVERSARETTDIRAKRAARDAANTSTKSADGRGTAISAKSVSRNVTDTPRSGGKAPKLWKHRPFSRVVRGWRAYRIVRDYIQLNEKEALGDIPYRKQRLKGLSGTEWDWLWQ